MPEGKMDDLFKHCLECVKMMCAGQLAHGSKSDHEVARMREREEWYLVKATEMARKEDLERRLAELNHA